MLTTVQVEPGSIPELAALFDATNRELVESHEDWLGAWFTANEVRSEITVIARWASAESYGLLRDTEQFQRTMSRFATKFVAQPSTSINEILIEM